MLCLSTNSPSDIPTQFSSNSKTNTPSDRPTRVTDPSDSTTPTDFPTIFPTYTTITPSDFPTQFPSTPTSQPVVNYSNALISNNIIIAIVIGILFGCLLFGVIIYFSCKTINCLELFEDKNSEESKFKRRLKEYDSDIEVLTNPAFNDDEQ